MNGARGRVSGMTAGIGMLLAIVVASPAIEQIPVGSLTGVLFMVVINTFNWKTFRMLWYLRKSDAVGIAMVTIVAVWQNLAFAVGCGIVWQALVISWDNGDVRHRSYLKKDADGNTKSKVYMLQNNLFFGAVDDFRNLFDYRDDPEEIVADFSECELCDFSAVVAVGKVMEQYKLFGKTLTYQNMSKKSLRRMQRAGEVVDIHRERRDSIAMTARIESSPDPLQNADTFVLQKTNETAADRKSYEEVDQTAPAAVEDAVEPEVDV